MLQKIKRETLAGSVFEEFEFEKPAARYLVKNFTDGDIYVSFDSTATTSNSSKISAGFYQIVEANENEDSMKAYMTDSVYIKGTGEVEVQQLWFR